MLRRLMLIAIVTLALLSPASAQIGGGIFGTRQPAQVIEVAKSGARFNTICGATCSADYAASGFLCAAGSALGSIPAGSTTRYIVKVNPGTYDECVNFATAVSGASGRDNVSLIGTDKNSVILRPTVTSSSSVARAVIFIPHSSQNIEIANLTIQNDAWPFTIGSTNGNAITLADVDQVAKCTGSECWDNVNIHDNIIISNDLAIRADGIGIGSAFPFFPHLKVINNDMRTGGKSIEMLSYMDYEIRGNTALLQTNYCDVASAGSNLSGTVDCTCRGGGAGPCTTTEFCIIGDSNPDQYWAGRWVEFADIPGGGACPVTDYSRRYVTKFDSLSDVGGGDPNNLVIVSVPLNAAPNSDCRYTFFGVKGAATATTTQGGGPPPCSDIDWSVMQGDPNQPVHKSAIFVWMGTVGNEVDYKALSGGIIKDNYVHAIVNDNAPEGGQTGGYGCGARTQIAGVVFKGGQFTSTIDNLIFEADINTEIEGKAAAFANGCAIDQVAGVYLSDSSVVNSSGGGTQGPPITFSNSTIRLRNNVDPDLDLYGVVGSGAAVNSWMPQRINVSNVNMEFQQPLIWAKVASNAGTVFTDITAAARDLTDAAVNAIPAVEVLHDALYIGVPNRHITEFTINLGTNGVGTAVTWEINNDGAGGNDPTNSGGKWTAMAGVASLNFSDGTNGLTQSGTVKFIPSYFQNWDERADLSNLERMFWIRARVTTASFTTTPTIKSIVVATGKNYAIGQYRDTVINASDVVPVPNAQSYITAGTIGWVKGQASVTSFGQTQPVWSTNTTAMVTDDMYCVRGVVRDGTKTLVNASLNVGVVGAGSATSICIYSSDGQNLELKRENIDTTSLNERSGALAASGTLPPGNHWFCIGSDDATGQFKGIVYGTASATTAVSNTSLAAAGATCPATIDLTTFSATAQAPEVVLTP